MKPAILLPEIHGAGVATGSASDGPCQATPREELIRKLLDCRIPKNEREHCAGREIEMLRFMVKQLTATLATAGAPEFQNAIHAAEWAQEIRNDKERLDWLDAQCRGVEFFTMDGPSDGAPPRQFFQVDGLGLEKARATLREAIDEGLRT